VDGGWTRSGVDGRSRGRSDAARLFCAPGMTGMGMG